MFILDAIILILGLSTTYTDIKFNKIRNKHLLLAIALGSVAYTYLITTQQIVMNWNLTWNILIGVGIALVLYFTDTWGAGDTKLFAIFCLLMPIDKHNTILYFPSIAIFTNIFIVGLVATIILSAEEIIYHRTTRLKKLFSSQTLYLIADSFLIIFSINWFIQTTISRLLPQASHIISIIILFIITRSIFWFKRKYKNNAIIPLVILFGLIARFLTYSLSFNIIELILQLKITAFYTFLFHGIFVILDLNSSDEKNKKIIPFAPLMLVGTLLTHTNLLNWISIFFKILRH